MMKLHMRSLAAAGLLAASLGPTASAADLGGNCCADLEERIAELEATSVRKGNRKVSLTISGWVNQQVTWWDDGGEQNLYVHDIGSTLGSHVKFTGAATISPGWSAGYVLQIEAMGSDGLTTDQGGFVDADGDGINDANGHHGPGALGGGYSTPQVLQSYWFIKSDMLGKLSVGKLSQASDNAAILVDGSGSLISANWVSFDINGFFVRNATTGALSTRRWGEAGGCTWGDCNGVPLNAVRYDSPSFGGFSVSASWGEDDFWDVAARYAGEFAGFRLAAAAAYSESTDLDVQGSNGIDRTEYVQAGVYLQHIATGLFALGNYGNFDVNQAGAISSDTWYVKGGLRQRFSSIGNTVLYGEWLTNSDGGNVGSELEMWGLGAVQEIDAAAMSIWVKYRHASVDGLVDGGAVINADDYQWVGAGALINF